MSFLLKHVKSCQLLEKNVNSTSMASRLRVVLINSCIVATRDVLRHVFEIHTSAPSGQDHHIKRGLEKNSIFLSQLSQLSLHLSQFMVQVAPVAPQFFQLLNLLSNVKSRSAAQVLVV